ncbi:MAG: DUF3336 domain-containing protein [Proteobacteria bacterium]|nr:DUF3336 domain-containing protein [Pseudomonadota bacterium]MCP4921703.1 DUF3336 domain-containing protein [Pseudomonadota bacterium]
MKRRELEQAVEAAPTYDEWVGLAEEFDRTTGADEWRDQDACPWYDAAAIGTSRDQLVRLRNAEAAEELAAALDEDLSRHLADIAAPQLYEVALAGTKRLVDSWLDAVEEALRWLAHTEIPGLPRAAKLQRFEHGWRVFGRSALMLSGGATWGFHHLGVVKALMNLDLLPHILSGASTGAMVAAGVCTRTDEELRQMFADTDSIRLDGLLPIGWRKAFDQKAWLDPARLHDVLQHNVGDWTFAEAFARSGRALNIAVSPTRSRQKPRLLTHLTAPNVMVASAALASSALPGLFPPVELEARQGDEVVSYVAGERWMDGSLQGDLPKTRLARLHNVNHFIVSQTNPHVMPFLRHYGRRGLRPTVLGVTSATLRTQGALVTDLARRATSKSDGLARQLALQAHTLATQDYRGDIDIYPRFRANLLTRVAVNPTRDDLAEFIREGERSVWPKVAMIRNQTRIGRVFRTSIEHLSR